MSSATHKKAKRVVLSRRRLSRLLWPRRLSRRRKYLRSTRTVEWRFSLSSLDWFQPVSGGCFVEAAFDADCVGDTSYTRGGGAKKILLKGIQLRGNVDFFNTGVNSGAYLTIVVVYDKDPVGSTANVVGDFLAANAGTDANSNSYNVALNNDGNAQRFSGSSSNGLCNQCYSDQHVY